MKLDDKRAVIEALLCCGQDVDGISETTGETACALDAPLAVNVAACRQWSAAKHSLSVPHGEVCITVAYRLIESSPTLRREWFGAP